MNGYLPHIIKRGILEGKTTIHKFSRTTSSEISNSNLKLIYFTMSYYGHESDHPTRSDRIHSPGYCYS
jgi:hypothetical protein